MEATYELQLYGFSLEQIAFQRRSFFNARLEKAIGRLIEKTQGTVDDKTVQLLVEQKTTVIKNIMDSLEENFKAFDMLDEKYLSVPGHVLLESDIEHSKQYDENTEKELDEKVEQLQNLYLQNCVMSESLDLQKSQFNKIKPYIDEQLATQAQVRECLKACDLNQMSTLISETMSTIDRLNKKD